jgi:TRAP-type C4-dicarboxylate transport system permease small subunit
VSPIAGDLTVGEIIQKVIGVIFGLGIMICPICIIWGGFEIATAAGDSNKIQKGKQIILYAVIGLAIIALSSALANLVNNTLAKP